MISFDLSHEGKWNQWPNWVTMKTRKTAFANSKNRPGVDYAPVAESIVIEETPDAVEAS